MLEPELSERARIALQQTPSAWVRQRELLVGWFGARPGIQLLLQLGEGCGRRERELPELRPKACMGDVEADNTRHDRRQHLREHKIV